MNVCFEEKIYNKKALRKVSNYLDKDGKVAREMIECLKWVDSLNTKKEIIKKACTRELATVYNKGNAHKYRHKINDIRNGSYARYMLNNAFNENKFNMEKIQKVNNTWIYSNIDVYKFFLVLLKSLDDKKQRQFLNIPDVFYIVRQIKKVGVDYYIRNNIVA